MSWECLRRMILPARSHLLLEVPEPNRLLPLDDWLVECDGGLYTRAGGGRVNSTGWGCVWGKKWVTLVTLTILC
jgi:hypothetical protein